MQILPFPERGAVKQNRSHPAGRQGGRPKRRLQRDAMTEITHRPGIPARNTKSTRERGFDFSGVVAPYDGTMLLGAISGA
jgi:hypothetical protein